MDDYKTDLVEAYMCMRLCGDHNIKENKQQLDKSYVYIYIWFPKMGQMYFDFQAR